MIDSMIKEKAFGRLRKIEGQINGIQKMVDDERYCIDIVNQITAVKRALEQVALMIMKNHMKTCVSEAIKVGNSTKKIDELMDTINRFVK